MKTPYIQAEELESKEHDVCIRILDYVLIPNKLICLHNNCAPRKMKCMQTKSLIITPHALSTERGYLRDAKCMLPSAWTEEVQELVLKIVIEDKCCCVCCVCCESLVFSGWAESAGFDL